MNELDKTESAIFVSLICSLLPEFSLYRACLVLSVAWSFGVQMVVFFCSGISAVLFHTLGVYVVSVEFLSLTHHRPYS